MPSSDAAATTSELKATFTIGSVARLTGVRVENLRAWERRYRLVTPQRSATGQRVYTQSDVVRLQLIKQLVELGDGVGSLASLSEDALRTRLQQFGSRAAEQVRPERPVRLLICGNALPYLVDSWRAELEPLTVLGTHLRYQDFESTAIAQRPEVLVLEEPVLMPEVASRLRALRLRSGADRLVVVYGFAVHATLERLRKEGVQVLRGPVSVEELKAACLTDVRRHADTPPEPDDALRPRRYDDRTLAALSTAATGIRCECPHHLADLVLRLDAFAAYSTECENRNPQDAALHAHLFATACRARALIEGAIDLLIHYEKLDLAPAGTDA
jgi:DNA-binding transcriptional MerR regulator